VSVSDTRISVSRAFVSGDLEDHEKELKKNLSKKEEENSRLKNLNPELLEQIRKLKEEKLENLDIKDINKSKS
jgi:hypothetical protein